MPEQRALQIIKELEKIKNNFKKAPNRICTARTLLRKKLEVESLKKQINAIAQNYDIKRTINKFREIQEEINTIIEFQLSQVELREDTDEETETRQIQTSTVINSQIQQNHNMAALDTFQTLKLVPLFDGEEKDLNNFINIVEIIGETLKDEDERKKLINLVLKTRITERVRIKLGAATIPSKITDFKKLLETQFKKKLNPLKIQNDLSRSRQGEQQIQQYANKIETLTAQLNNVQITERGEENRTIIMALNDKTALNAFQAGLSEPFKTAVFAAMPTTWEQAVKIATEIEAVNETQKKVYQYNSYSTRNRNFRDPRPGHYNNRNNNWRTFNNTNRNHNNSNRMQQFHRANNLQNRQHRDINQNQNQGWQQRPTYNNQRQNRQQPTSSNMNRRRGNANRRINLLNSGNGLSVPEAQQSRDEETYIELQN